MLPGSSSVARYGTMLRRLRPEFSTTARVPSRRPRSPTPSTTLRCFVASKPQSKESYDHIPDPTWSVQDLELTKTHTKLPPQEMERLARLSLLDLEQLRQDTDEDLEQDLANMMHMVQQVSDYVAKNNLLDEEEMDESQAAQHIYDSVRGVTAAPLRSKDDDSLQEVDQAHAENVWESYLAPNTIRQGGSHHYFSSSTKEDACS